MGVPNDYRDMTGRSPDEASYLLGKSYVHTRTQRRYLALGFAWIGDLDQWGVLHQELDKPESTVFIRSIANFCGKHLDGAPRFDEAQIEEKDHGDNVAHQSPA